MQQSSNRPTSPQPTVKQSRLQGCLPPYKTILKIEGAILLVVSIASLILSWDIGLSLTWVGLGAIAFGGMSLIGGVSITRDFVYQHAQSAGPLDIRERAKAEIRERGSQIEFLILMIIVGTLTIFLGFIASILAI